MGVMGFDFLLEAYVVSEINRPTDTVRPRRREPVGVQYGGKTGRTTYRPLSAYPHTNKQKKYTHAASHSCAAATWDH